MNEEAVLARARSAGVAVDWTDATGRPQRVRTESLRRLLEALNGVDTPLGVPPLVTARLGQAIAIAGLDGDHPAELLSPRLHPEAAPHAFTAGERRERLRRGAALHLGVGMAGPGQSGRRGVDRLSGVRPLRAGALEADDSVRLQQVGQRGWDVSDLVVGGLAEPPEELLVRG